MGNKKGIELEKLKKAQKEIENLKRQLKVIEMQSDVYNKIIQTDITVINEQLQAKEIEYDNFRKIVSERLELMEGEESIIKNQIDELKAELDTQIKNDDEKENDGLVALKLDFELENLILRSLKSKTEEIGKDHQSQNTEPDSQLYEEIKKFVKGHQTLIIFLITTIIALLGTMAKLYIYYMIMGKFDYWRISREDISIFGNGIDAYVSYGLAILIFVLYSVIFNKCRQNQCKEKLSLDKGDFYFLYIPLCMNTLTTISTISLWKLNFVLYQAKVIIFMALDVALLSLVVPCVYMLNQKRDITYILFLIYIFIINIINCVIISKSTEEKFLKVFILGLCITALYYIKMSMLGYVVLSFLEKTLCLLIRFIDYNRISIQLSRTVVRMVTFILILLPLFYALNVSLMESKKHYTIVEAELANENKVKEYIVLQEHRNQYYVSDFEINNKKLIIFNGEYWIISKEGIKIRNQQFSKVEKTDKSRDEYLEMQKQIREFYSYIFTIGNTRLQKSTNNE